MPTELASGNEHFYINVFGRAKNQEACPQFCDHTGSTHQGNLTGRPTHYTPIRVPRFDEEATLALRLVLPEDAARWPP